MKRNTHSRQSSIQEGDGSRANSKLERTAKKET